MGFAKPKLLEIGQTRQVFQTRVGDRRLVNIQSMKVGQAFDMLQTGVGDIGLGNTNLFHISQRFCDRC